MFVQLGVNNNRNKFSNVFLKNIIFSVARVFDIIMLPCKDIKLNVQCIHLLLKF